MKVRGEQKRALQETLWKFIVSKDSTRNTVKVHGKQNLGPCKSHDGNPWCARWTSRVIIQRDLARNKTMGKLRGLSMEKSDPRMTTQRDLSKNKTMWKLTGLLIEMDERRGVSWNHNYYGCAKN